MICSRCKDEGEKSTVFVVDKPQRHQPEPPDIRFWDEAGVYHVHDPRPYISRYRCSRGHRWRREALETCSARGCKVGIDPPKYFDEGGSP